MASTRYVPERRDVIWLDFKPIKGKEIGKASLEDFRETLAKLLPLIGAEAVNELS